MPGEMSEIPYDLNIDRRAEQAMKDHWEFCNDLSEGFGDRFFDTLFACLDRIQVQPYSYPIAFDDVRKGRVDLTKRMRFLIFYRVDEASRSIVVSDIVHAASNWKP